MTTRISETEIPLIPGTCLCVITGVEGPSYRPVGAGMAVAADGSRVGALSSGCIDDDVAIHAADALGTGRATRLRYGRGSPFMDLQLPCGGGLDISLIPLPDVAAALARLAARQPAAVELDGLSLTILPRVRVLVFGTGPEAEVFASLARAAGLQVETPSDTWTADSRTAIALFFHDHSREIPILQRAMATDAFFIGAQGSQRVREERAAALGHPADPRLELPFGLIGHARDPQTLAAGVLAQILALSRDQGKSPG